MINPYYINTYFAKHMGENFAPCESGKIGVNLHPLCRVKMLTLTSHNM